MNLVLKTIEVRNIENEWNFSFQRGAWLPFRTLSRCENDVKTYKMPPRPLIYGTTAGTPEVEMVIYYLLIISNLLLVSRRFRELWRPHFTSHCASWGGHWGFLNTALPQFFLQIPQYRKKKAKYRNIAMRSIECRNRYFACSLNSFLFSNVKAG